MSQLDMFGTLPPTTVDVLDAVDSDHRRDWDRTTIDAAVRAVAAANGGEVDTNAVRRELTGPCGLIVNPRCVGPRLAALTRQGVLEVVGWSVSDDTAGRNAGKPQKLRRWVRGVA